MFQIGDYVIYGYDGVCRVEDICYPDIKGIDKRVKYYKLVPHYQKNCEAYAPVDTKTFMRPVISRAELDEMIERIKTIEPCDDLPTDMKQITNYYQDMLQTHDCEVMIQLIKTVFCKQQARKLEKKSAMSTDQRYLRQAEDMLYGEFGFVLGIAPDQVKDYINDAVERSKTVKNQP